MVDVAWTLFQCKIVRSWWVLCFDRCERFLRIFEEICDGYSTVFILLQVKVFVSV